MEKTEVTSSCTAGSAQPNKKKSFRKPSTVRHITVGETEPPDSITDEIAQPMKKKNCRKPSTVVNVIENPEITDNGASGSAQHTKKKNGRKPITVSNILEETEFIAKALATSQSFDINSTSRPPAFVNVANSTGILSQNLGNSTASSQSAIENKSADTPSTSANAITDGQRARPAKKKSARKPSVVVKRGTKLLKKDRFKPPRSVFIPVASETLDYRGSFLTRGDIVSVVGVDDRVYYAQIRGLLQNQYSEKSAVLTWLFPTTESPKDRFDPDTYVFGNDEDIPRDLEYLEFVCHAPSEYFKCSNPSYPELPQKPDLGFAQTRKGYVKVKLPFEDFSTDSE